jgi:hypothetical protein
MHMSRFQAHKILAMGRSLDMDWPLRWDLLTRYRLIEIVAQWEGRLTTNHLINSFGIGRQQASKDINTYLQEIAPDNLIYDKYLKGYRPSESFTPKLRYCPYLFRFKPRLY